LAGIYIHIPFCKQACHYCNFHFATSLQYKNELIAALLNEISLQKNYAGEEIINTIYFGGGTPSLCTKEELQSIIAAIQLSFTVSSNPEITLEANPDDITETVLLDWKEAGINRLSIGIQSFFEEDLQWMNRAHTSKQAIEALQMAVQHFDNITADLIYGTPQLTNEKWKTNVDTLLSLQIPHFSCYALTVEPKTPLYKMIQQHMTANVNPDKQSEQFLLLMQWMEESGFEHYEISNFAKPGKRSRHNAAYWQGEKYIGLGPSAHSFNGTERQWNVANNKQYIEAINNGTIPFEKEVLTVTQRTNEYIMTALRTIEGIEWKRIDFTTSTTKESWLKKTERFVESGLVQIQNERLVLTKEGKLLADGIAADLFFD